MVEITFLELHFDDSTLSTGTPFGSGSKEVSASDEPTDEEGSSSKGKLVAALVGLVFLAAVAFVVRKKVLGGDAEPEEEGFEMADVKA